MRRLLLVIGAALALGVTGAPAEAQEGAAQVRTLLDGGMAPHTQRGYRRERAIPDLVTSLRLDGAYLWAVNLRAGVNYRIYGACDEDCADVDMEVYGADGVLVEKDIARNDTPFVQVMPARTGRHYVRIWLFDCSAEPCFVGARVVSGGRPEERPAEPEGQEDNEYTDAVREELDSAGARHLAAGYAPIGEDVIVPVQMGPGHREVMRLEAGRAYLFQGVCDQDCSDVDLEVLDGRGTSIARDVATDDRPVVGVEPAQSGDYTVRVWLAQCSVEPCFVGVRSYTRANR